MWTREPVSWATGTPTTAEVSPHIEVSMSERMFPRNRQPVCPPVLAVWASSLLLIACAPDASDGGGGIGGSTVGAAGTMGAAGTTGTAGTTGAAGTTGVAGTMGGRGGASGGAGAAARGGAAGAGTSSAAGSTGTGGGGDACAAAAGAAFAPIADYTARDGGFGAAVVSRNT